MSFSKSLSFFLFVAVVSVSLPDPALAYIGPGAGLSAIGTLVAVIGAGFLLIVGFVWYPVKRLLRKKNAPAEGPRDAASDDSRT